VIIDLTDEEKKEVEDEKNRTGGLAVKGSKITISEHGRVHLRAGAELAGKIRVEKAVWMIIIVQHILDL
jgi:hypothetical protein